MEHTDRLEALSNSWKHTLYKQTLTTQHHVPPCLPTLLSVQGAGQDKRGAKGNKRMMINPCFIEVANLVYTKWCLTLSLLRLPNRAVETDAKKNWKVIETLTHGYLSDRNKKELSNEYQNDSVEMTYELFALLDQNPTNNSPNYTNIFFDFEKFPRSRSAI